MLPGYRKITNPKHVEEVCKVWGIKPEEMPQPGVSAYEMFELMQDKTIRGLYLLCSNPAVSAPNQNFVRAALKNLDFMVCADIYLSESAEFADVVLPSVTWSEDEGTVTNLEGRIIKINKAQEPVGESKPDWLIQVELAERLGRGQYFGHLKTARDVADEFRLASKGGYADYYGATWEKIDKQDGVFWPCEMKQTRARRICSWIISSTIRMVKPNYAHSLTDRLPRSLVNNIRFVLRQAGLSIITCPGIKQEEFLSCGICVRSHTSKFIRKQRSDIISHMTKS